jgi:predicted nucleic acid-binding protein
VILVDTSVWIRYLSNREPFASHLDQILDTEEAVGHEFVFGELLVGDRGGRSILLTSYALIPQLKRLPHSEVIEFARARRLLGLGIGWIDMHLLASTVVSGAQLYTTDRRLQDIANDLGVAYR